VIIRGMHPVFLTSKARARSCISVSERKKASPTLLAEAFTSSKYSSEGGLTLSLPFSMAILNRTRVIEFTDISSSTSGTVVCSSLTDKGSNPDKKAEVSSTSIRLPGIFL